MLYQLPTTCCLSHPSLSHTPFDAQFQRLDSADYADEGTEALYPVEVLNSLDPQGLPPHHVSPNSPLRF